MAGEKYSIWIPIFRICRVSDDKVVITPPVLFGRGYVFDRTRGTVSISRRLLGFPISKTQAPFEQITSLSVKGHYEEGSSGYLTGSTYVPGTPGGTFFELTMKVGGKEFKIEKPTILANWERRGRAERIKAAIRRVIWSR